MIIAGMNQSYWLPIFSREETKMWRTGFEEGHDARKEGMGQWMMQSLLVQAAAYPSPAPSE